MAIFTDDLKFIIWLVDDGVMRGGGGSKRRRRDQIYSRRRPPAITVLQRLGYFFIFLSFLGTFFLFKTAITIQNASKLWELLISYFHPFLSCTIASPQIHFRWDQVDFLIPTHETNPAPARSQITQGRCHIFRL